MSTLDFPHQPLVRETEHDWSIAILPPDEQRQFDRLHAVLTDTLGLDWKASAGAPDGWEVANDCAVALWDAGFRVTTRPPSRRDDHRETADELGEGDE